MFIIIEDVPFISGILFSILFSLTTLIYFIISLLEYSFFQIPSNYLDNNQKPKNVIDFYIKNFIEQPESPLFTWFIFRILIIIFQTILLWLFLINYFIFFNLIIILLLAFLIVISIDYIFAEWISFLIIKYVNPQKIIKSFLWIFIPFIAINKYLINIFPILKKVFSHRFAKKEEVTIDELTDAIHISTNNESINTPISVLLRGVINLNEIEVKEIMKPRVDVVAISVESSFNCRIGIFSLSSL